MTVDLAEKIADQPTIEEVDQAIASLGTRRLVPARDLPEWIDYTGLRVVTEHVHEDAIRDGGRVNRYYEFEALMDLLLDLRNKIEIPIRTV